MKLGKQSQQEQTPSEPQPEIITLPGLVIHLYEKTEPEQQGESGERLSREQEKDRIPYPLIQRVQPRRLAFRQVINIVMLQIMQKDNRHKSKTPQGIDNAQTFRFQ